MTMTLVIYVLLTYIGGVQLYLSWKTRRTSQYQLRKRVDPYSMFSKSESMIVTDESALIIAKGFLFNGISIFVILTINIVFNLVDSIVMFLISFVIILISWFFTHNKAYFMHEDVDNSNSSQ